MTIPLLRDDLHDDALRRLVKPPGWVNPKPAPRYHLVVLGGGPAGLVCAAGAAALGARVALVERDLLGGGLPQRRLRPLQGSDPRLPRLAGGPRRG